ncbi:hypothetical protein GCM10009665_71490 [Kitasatospora nipponensis]|uniref:Uncharacterized protein n=1 Tax=Kitasatospora nipponensis TaxID=258049 RepID=A0ABN1X5N6_9ACTN
MALITIGSLNLEHDGWTSDGLGGGHLEIRLLNQVRKTYPSISKSRVDAGFENAVVEHGASLGIDVEVVHRKSNIPGFHVAKRRWEVERKPGMNHALAAPRPRLRGSPASSEAMIHITSIDGLAKRITDESTPTWRGMH